MTRILHVDDEDDIREIARIALEAFGGFSVTEARSGREGLALAAELRPDLILLDVMMPGMDGPDTLRALRADPATAAIPVVFMTAKAHRSELERYRSMGVQGVIAKPFDPVTLAAEVKALGAAAGAAAGAVRRPDPLHPPSS